MTLIKDALKGFALAHALPIAGLLFSGAVLTYGAVKIFIGMERHNGFVAGATFVRDSAREVTILRLAAQHAKDTLRAAESARAARDSSSALVAESRRFDTAQRHTPRIEALSATAAMPVVPLDSLVGVTVENTNEHFVLPRKAAMYWQTADSLVGQCQILLQKYAKANHDWSEAWHAENEARVGADSLAALWRGRALANGGVVRPNTSKLRRTVQALAWTSVVWFAARRFR